MPDGKRNPSRLPEGRSRKPAGDKRETGKGERRCERRDEQRQEWPRNATQAGRGEPGPVRPRRDRRERSRRRRPRRRIIGRAPARAASARPHPVGRRPRRLGGEHCRRGDDRRRRQARVMAGCSRRKRRARGRRRRLGPVDPCHSRVTRTQRVGSGRNSGRRDGGRDQDAGHHGGRRDGGWWRDLREVAGGPAGGAGPAVREESAEAAPIACITAGRAAAPAPGATASTCARALSTVVVKSRTCRAESPPPGRLQAPPVHRRRLPPEPIRELKIACPCGFAAKSSSQASSPGPRPDRRDVSRADAQQNREDDHQERHHDGGRDAVGLLGRADLQWWPRGEASDEVRRAGAGTCCGPSDTCRHRRHRRPAVAGARSARRARSCHSGLSGRNLSHRCVLVGLAAGPDLRSR